MEGSQQLQINSGVRSVLARHLVDPRGVEVGVSRSIVRLRGQIYRLSEGAGLALNAGAGVRYYF